MDSGTADQNRSVVDRVPEFDARYVPHLRAAEDRHFWFRARNAIIATLIRQIEPALAPDYRVLEVGCGTGNTLRVLHAECRRGRVFGIDSQLEGLVYARERVRGGLVQGDLRELPFAPAVRFNLIGAFDVLEHLDDDEDVLAMLRDWLTPEGALLLTVPTAPRLWSTFDESAHHRRRYTYADLSKKLTDAGYRVEYLSPFMAALYPLMWARRRFMPRLRGTPPGFESISDELRIVPMLNPALVWILSREAASIGSRRRLAFGTSLIALARPR